MSEISVQKLNGSVRSNRKSFEKTGPPFEVDYFSQSDRSEFWLNGSRPLSIDNNEEMVKHIARPSPRVLGIAINFSPQCFYLGIQKPRYTFLGPNLRATVFTLGYKVRCSGASIQGTPSGPRQVSPEWRLGWGLLVISQQIIF